MKVLFVVFFLLNFLFSPEAYTKNPWGVNSNLETDPISDKVVELGSQWVRLSVQWFKIEQRKGEFDWHVPDVQIERARQRNLNLYLNVGGTPAWANGEKGENIPPINAEDWADFVKALAERYGGYFRVKAFGMWNEPNLNEFWKGTAEEYVRKIVIPGYNAIKTVAPTKLVGAPEMSHHWRDQRRWRLADVLKMAGSHVDIVTLHYYPDSEVDFEAYLDKEVRPLLKEKQLWITEVGDIACSEKKGSDERQKDAYSTFLKAQRLRTDWFTRVFFYRIWDPVDNCNDGNGFGLTYGSLLTERPSFHVYRQHILENAD